MRINSCDIKTIKAEETEEESWRSNKAQYPMVFLHMGGVRGNSDPIFRC